MDPGSEIKSAVEDVYGQFGYVGVARRYDIIFTDRGVLFAVTVGALKAGVAAGVRGGLVAGGGAGGAAASGAMSRTEEDMAKGGFADGSRTAAEILALDKNNRFIPYDNVKSISIKKGLGSGKLTIESTEGRFYAQFPNERVDPILKVLTPELVAKMR